MQMQSKALIDQLKRLNGIAANSKTDETFSGVLLEQSSIMASNALFAMKITTMETVDSPVVIPNAAVDLILNLPDSELDLAVEGTNLTITSGKIRATFTTRSASEYPRIKTFDNSSCITLDWPKFRDVLSRVAFACAKTHANAALTGVHIFTDANGLNVNACDSYRLACDSIDIAPGASVNVCISREAVTKLVNVFDGDTVRFSISKAFAKFEDDTAEFNVRLIDAATYPDVKKIIPNYANSGEINADQFLSMLHRTTPLCPQLTLEVAGLVMEITGRFDGGLGDIKDEIELASPIKTPVSIRFNASYLRDAFKAMPDNKVEIGFDDGPSSGIKPMILKSGSVLMLIVPVRV